MLRRALYIVCCILLLQGSSVFAQEQIDVGIDEKLGAIIPDSLVFFDENGDTINLRSIIKKPTIMMLVFYSCKGLCSPLMAEVASLVPQLDMAPGREYQLVSISFDPDEKPEMALERKNSFLPAIQMKFPEDAWRFLTGDPKNIKAITELTGYRYRKDGEFFVHPGALIVVSPHGKITRYLLGTTFMPFDIKMSIANAVLEQVSPTIAKTLKMCYSNEPVGKRNYETILRIFLAITLVSAGVFVFLITRSRKKVKIGE